MNLLDLMMAAPESDRKRCSDCGQSKPLAKFHRNNADKDGRQARCGSCISARKKMAPPGCPTKTCAKCHTTKPFTDFRASKNMPDGCGTECIACLDAWAAARDSGDLEVMAATRLVPPEDATKFCIKCRTTKPVTAFTRNAKRIDGRTAECRTCRRAAEVAKPKIVPEDGMQTCSGCKTKKSLTAFEKDPGRRSGHAGVCRECRLAQKIALRAATPPVPENAPLTCTRCEKTKPAAAFARDWRSPTGYRTHCAECVRERAEVRGGSEPPEEGATQACSACGEVKPFPDFKKNWACPSGYGQVCKSCTAKQDLERQVLILDDAPKLCTSCNTVKFATEFGSSAYTKDGRHPYCKTCRVEQQGAYAKSPAGKTTARRAYIKAAPARLPKARAYILRKAYDLTPEQFDQMLAIQDGRCAICRSPDPRGAHNVFSVDHCHETGRVRGLLCAVCNLRLGQLGDTPERLAKVVDYVNFRLLIPKVVLDAVPPARRISSRKEAKLYKRASRLRQKYNLSLGQYDTMLAFQDDGCALCESTDPHTMYGHFHVDHCHDTGAVRGLLCGHCNGALGVFGDQPKPLARVYTYVTEGLFDYRSVSL